MTTANDTTSARRAKGLRPTKSGRHLKTPDGTYLLAPANGGYIHKHFLRRTYGPPTVSQDIAKCSASGPSDLLSTSQEWKYVDCPECLADKRERTR